MGYEIFQRLCEKNGVKPADVAKATGISTATISSWKTGKYTPKEDKRRMIADFFNVPLEYLDTGEMPEQYYFNPETAQIAQEIYDDKDLHALFDAARGSSPEDLKMAAEMLRKFKATNPDE